VLVFESGGRAPMIEMAGVFLISCAVFFIFVFGHPVRAFAAMPLANVKNIFLPFGAILFSIAGWTSVEQVYEIKKRNGGTARIFLYFIFGAALASVLYWLFALGILGSVPRVTVDTISSIGAWPFWKRDILAVIGLLAMGTVSIPLSREIRGALEKDLGWNDFISRAVIVILPLVVVLCGLTNFLVIVSLVGGVFISAQYILIILVGRRTLRLTGREKTLLDILTAIFICAAVYEVASFIVH
jgi:hypothetical protein